MKKVILALVVLLAGCATAPATQKPATKIPTQKTSNKFTTLPPEYTRIYNEYGGDLSEYKNIAYGTCDGNYNLYQTLGYWLADLDTKYEEQGLTDSEIKRANGYLGYAEAILYHYDSTGCK